MSEKQIKNCLIAGISSEAISWAVKFLKDNNAEFYNLVCLGNDDFRLMYRDEKKVVQAKIFQLND